MIETKKKSVVSIEVEISINHLEFDLKEAYSKEETDSIYEQKAEKSLNESRPHRPLLVIELNELVINYNMAKTGLQTITCVLGHFDISDKTLIINPNDDTQ